MVNAPSTNGHSGRDAGGRFARGNTGGPGNPHAQRVARLRSVLLKSVDGAAIQQIMAALTRKAEAGDVAAASLILGYTVGKPDAVRGSSPEQRPVSFTISFPAPTLERAQIGARIIESVSRALPASPES